jgi:non-ribosomal peptide synthetase component F
LKARDPIEYDTVMRTRGLILFAVLGGLTLGNQVTLAQDQGVQATGGLDNTPASVPKLSVPAEDDLVLNNLVMSALADLDSPEPKTVSAAAERLQSADVRVIDLLEPLLKSGNLSQSQQAELSGEPETGKPISERCSSATLCRCRTL